MACRPQLSPRLGSSSAVRAATFHNEAFGQSQIGTGGIGVPFGRGSILGPRDPFAEFGCADPVRNGAGGDFFKPNLTGEFENARRAVGIPDGEHTSSGQYSCQSFVMSSRSGADGKEHTEQYATSEVGHRGEDIRETQQFYRNTSSGIEKLGLERQLGDKGRKLVEERNLHNMEVVTSEMFKGIDESKRDHFELEYMSKAHHLPDQPKEDPLFMKGNSAGIGDVISSGSFASADHDRHRSLPLGRRML